MPLNKKLLFVGLVLACCSGCASHFLETLKADKDETKIQLDETRQTVKLGEEAIIAAKVKDEVVEARQTELEILQAEFEALKAEDITLRRDLAIAQSAGSAEQVQELETRLRYSEEASARLTAQVNRTTGSLNMAKQEARDARAAAEKAEIENQRLKPMILALDAQFKALERKVDARKDLETAEHIETGLESFENLGDKFSGMLPGGDAAWGLLVGLLSILGVKKYVAKNKEKATEKAEKEGVA